ncbi:LacI family DNA-binding transcriptional regulator [Paenibacillus thalictri]|uniref:LacI family DNA-binding transcriptional regulator n=1 Tax=Paenibacillus thalictri TaxID=2527873 RepID=UPI001F0D71AB|nr:LacI family DNA-binding transcriptional regulator [Paenibacillus thalictri]
MNSHEIAKLAGVSRSTVSRVINNYPNVPQKTREKVMEVIKKYNYFPNLSGRALKGKKTNTLGLFITEEHRITEESSFNFLITNVIESASESDYYVLTKIIHDTSDMETIRSVKECFFQGRVDAGIFFGFANHEPMIEELIADGFLIGIIDQELPGRTEPNRIVFNNNNESVAIRAVDYLVGLNHRKIGHIRSGIRRGSTNAKYNGFMKAIQKHNLTLNDAWILPGYVPGGGYEAVANFLKAKHPHELPTAFFADNDTLAIGAVRAFNDHGISVPGDISIIGVNDHMLSSMMKPALTTFKINFGQLANELVRQIVDVIENGSQQFVKVIFEIDFIERESCRRLEDNKHA